MRCIRDCLPDWRQEQGDRAVRTLPPTFAPGLLAPLSRFPEVAQRRAIRIGVAIPVFARLPLFSNPSGAWVFVRAMSSARVRRKFRRAEVRNTAEQCGQGRRNEMARQAIASYVNKIVIDPGQKTAVMTVNAGLVVPECDASGNDGPRSPDSPKKPDDPPSGGSQVAPIAGARFGSNVRPRYFGTGRLGKFA
ncbi:MAG: hypothetical protein AMXMBFR58_38280 [Phycisphaerae bacterium]